MHLGNGSTRIAQIKPLLLEENKIVAIKSIHKGYLTFINK